MLVWVEEKVRGYKGERLGGKESARSSSLAELWVSLGSGVLPSDILRDINQNCSNIYQVVRGLGTYL